MADEAACEAALHKLANTIAANSGSAPSSLDRSLTCRITDLDIVFGGHLYGGTLRDLRRVESDQADIRLTVSSDDLVALVDGKLNFAAAWASGQVGINASVFDLLKLRALL